MKHNGYSTKVCIVEIKSSFSVSKTIVSVCPELIVLTGGVVKCLDEP